jgi:predicted ester cyclase
MAKGADMNDHPKAVAQRFYQIINDHSAWKLDEICSQDLRGHAGAGADLYQLKQSIGSFAEAFPDLRADLRYLICEGDLVSTWVSYEGTHHGEFAGVSGTARPVKFAAWDLIRVEDGRIVEITQYCDVFTLMNQIGALPTSTPA